MEQHDIQIVPSGEFRANPGKYLASADKEPVAISSGGRVFMTIGGLVDLDEADTEEQTSPAESRAR